MNKMINLAATAQLLSLCLCASVVSGAQVQFNLGKADATAQTNRPFYLYDLLAPRTNGAGGLVTRDRISSVTDASGHVIVSNLLWGNYRSELVGTWGTTTNWYQFPVTNGLIQAADWFSGPTNSSGGLVYVSIGTPGQGWNGASLVWSNGAVVWSTDGGAETNLSGVAVATNQLAIASSNLFTLANNGASTNQAIVGGLPLYLARRPLPPMGWNSYGGVNTEGRTKAMVDFFKSNHWDALGYQYITLDDSTFASRDGSNNLVTVSGFTNLSLRSISDYCHTNGMYFGVYTETATNTQAGYVGTGDFFTTNDAVYFVKTANVDYIKIDGSDGATTASEEFPKKKLIWAIQAQGRPVFVNIGTFGFSPWLAGVANSWRLAGATNSGTGNGGYGDVITYSAFLLWLDDHLSHRDYVRPGFFCDMDLIYSSLPDIEERSQFAMTCMMASPILLRGNAPLADYRGNANYTNAEVIAVDQDPLVIAANKVWSNSLNEVWMKPLSGPGLYTKAVALMNRNSSAQSITMNWTNIGLNTNIFTVRDLWANSYVGYATNNYTTNVLSHNTELFSVTPGMLPALQPGNTYLSDMSWMPVNTNSFRGEGDLGNFGIAIAKDKSRQGNTLTINGVTYAKGLGLYADSFLQYFVGGTASVLHFSCGVDDEVGSGGTLKFQVLTDGTLVFDSGTMAYHTTTITTNVNVSGAQVVTIKVTNTGAGADSNNDADLANAYFVCPSVGTFVGDGNSITNLNLVANGGLTNLVASPSTVTFANGTVTITNGAMESAISLTDDFIAGNGVSQTIGDLGWASTASFTVQSETVWPHVGTADVATPTSNGGAASIYLGTTGGLWGLNTNTWASTWIFKLLSTNNCIALFGFAGPNRQVQWPFAGTDQAGVWGGYNYSNSAFFIFSSYGNFWTQGRTVNSTIKADTSWHKLTMNGSASGVSFAIDGETPQTIATTPANQITTNVISPVFGIGNASTDATSHTLRVDYFGLRYYGVTR